MNKQIVSPRCELKSFPSTSLAYKMTVIILHTIKRTGSIHCRQRARRDKSQIPESIGRKNVGVTEGNCSAGSSYFSVVQSVMDWTVGGLMSNLSCASHFL